MCIKAPEDGKFTFRHDNIVNYIAKCLDREKFSVYADIEGSQTAAGGTIPPEVMVTNLKPDLVVIDRKKKSVSIFQLTVPNESRIETAHVLKMEKYQHILTDIVSFQPSVVPFEIGSVSGYISRRNNTHLIEIHKFCKANIKMKYFCFISQLLLYFQLQKQ